MWRYNIRLRFVLLCTGCYKLCTKKEIRDVCRPWDIVVSTYSSAREKVPLTFLLAAISWQSSVNHTVEAILLLPPPPTFRITMRVPLRIGITAAAAEPAGVVVEGWMDRWMDGCLVGRKHAPFSFAIVVLSVCRVLRMVGRRPRFGFAPYEFKLSSCATACGTRRNDCCCFSSMCLATYFPHLYTFRSFVRSLGRSPTILSIYRIII